MKELGVNSSFHAWYTRIRDIPTYPAWFHYYRHRLAVVVLVGSWLTLNVTNRLYSRNGSRRERWNSIHVQAVSCIFQTSGYPVKLLSTCLSQICRRDSGWAQFPQDCLEIHPGQMRVVGFWPGVWTDQTGQVPGRNENVESPLRHTKVQVDSVVPLAGRRHLRKNSRFEKHE